LQQARAKGPAAFGQAYDGIQPKAPGSIADAIQGDFEAARKHELFQQWWTTNAFARFLRDQMEDRLSGPIGTWLQKVLAAFVDVPIDIGTALLLSFFICIDFPNLRTGFRGLRDTWLRNVFDEIVPALADLGRLVARALIAQGLIALCNATMVFVALTLLGVEHEVLLSTMTFILCLVPTLGACIALVIISLFALLQFGGGVTLAFKAAGAVTVVLIIESFVLSPRILGKMMELHPVLIVALLPIAQYFFGIWGLILAAPVSVYVINVIIFNRGLPGERAHAPPAAG
jgi:predicted PurR-regulated permease PerM